MHLLFFGTTTDRQSVCTTYFKQNQESKAKRTERSLGRRAERRKNEKIYDDLDWGADLQHRKRDDRICIVHLCVSDDRKCQLCVNGNLACLSSHDSVKPPGRCAGRPVRQAAPDDHR